MLTTSAVPSSPVAQLDREIVILEQTAEKLRTNPDGKSVRSRHIDIYSVPDPHQERVAPLQTLLATFRKSHLRADDGIYVIGIRDRILPASYEEGLGRFLDEVTQGEVARLQVRARDYLFNFLFRGYSLESLCSGQHLSIAYGHTLGGKSYMELNIVRVGDPSGQLANIAHALSVFR